MEMTDTHIKKKTQVYLRLHPLLPKRPRFARAQLFKEQCGIPIGSTGSAIDAQEASSQPHFLLHAGVLHRRPSATSTFTQPLVVDGVQTQRNPMERVKQPVDALPMRLPHGAALLTTGKH